MRMYRPKFVRLVAGLAMGATVFQVAGCNPISSITGFLTNTFNPCGSVLLCDPAEYTFRTSGYDGPGFDPEIDPACTFPPFCNPDPFVGGLAGGP